MYQMQGRLPEEQNAERLNADKHSTASSAWSAKRWESKCRCSNTVSSI